MDRKTLKGMAVATAVVGLLSAGYGLKADQGGKEEPKTVKCQGINSCAGHGECGAPDGSHDCAGKNSCKGKGWVKVKSADECTEKGGTVLKDKEE
jgi:hypothetical protein